jgi:hemolysin activation/secretion protein
MHAGECAPLFRRAENMQTQMTISTSDTGRTIVRAMLVIIGAGIFSLFSPRVFSATPPSLTTALTTVIVDGSTAYSAPKLFAAYRDQLGQPVTRDGARVIANALADLYVNDGFVKPEVAMDDTSGANGMLRVRVYEAQVTNVIFEGDLGRRRDALEQIGARLENTRPLRKNDVPDALRAMRQLAGLAVTATTRRDPQVRNAFELVVHAEFSAIDGVVRMNNRGTDQAGPMFLLGQVFANGLLGRQEKIGLIFAAATDHEEYLGGGLYFDKALGEKGTRMNALLFGSHSAPNEAPVNLDDEYSRERMTFRVTHPLRQGSTLTLNATGAFEADDLTIDRAGTSIREERLRVIETGLRASWRGTANTQYSMNLQVRKGLDALGGGLHATDLVNDPRRADFLVAQLQGSSYRRFAERWSVRLDAFSQFTNYVLPDTERFKIGGDRLGRGFEVAEIAGDRGAGAKIELRRDVLNTESVLGRVSAYGFYDFGAAWKQDRPGRDSAATAGTGVSIQGGPLTGYLEVAAPLTGPDIEGKREASVFAELSYRF